MTDPDLRPLPARLDAYIANLQSIASQLDELRVNLERSQLKVDGSGIDELGRTVGMYRAIADDLTKVVNGEKLTEFRVEGTL